MNLATKAPNFTKENAAEMARRANISRKANIERERAQLEADKEAFRLSMASPTEEARKKRIESQIDMMLEALSKERDNDMRIKLTGALDKLWNLVYAKAGVNRPSKSKSVRSNPVEPIS